MQGQVEWRWGGVAVMLCLMITSLTADVIVIPMDQQINLGQGGTSHSPNGDAIYNLIGQDDWLEFRNDESEGYVRNHLGDISLFYMFVDLNLTGIGPIDLSDPCALVQIDLRYYQDPVANIAPYTEGNVSLRLYTYEEDGETYLGCREYLNAYQAVDDTWYCLCCPVVGGKDFDKFEPNNVSRLRIFGKNEYGGGNDYLDCKNLVFSPSGPECLLTADLTDDCGVDFQDFAILATEWMNSADPDFCPLRAELAGCDCRVDLLDFNILLFQWLRRNEYTGCSP